MEPVAQVKRFLIFVVVKRDRGQLETVKYGLFSGPNSLVRAMATPNMQSVTLREATTRELGT